jgi:phi LC3 family holin
VKINWKVRLKNPVWWAQMLAAVVMPLVLGMGYAWDDMTTWAKLGEVLLAALNNPVVFVAMLTSAWGVVTDPTTAGMSDSPQALEYDEPKGA